MGGTRPVRVAVVDSGVNPSHPHIGRVAGGLTVVPGAANGGDFLDRVGHGTAVTAAIQERAPGADLFIVKVFDRALSASIDTLVAGIDAAWRHGADLINLSLGTPNRAHAAALRAAADRAAAAGALIGYLIGSVPVGLLVGRRYGIDVRYRGQGNEITVWLGEGAEWPTDDAETLAAFEEEYKRVYGLTIDDVAAEVVTWRLSVWAPVTGVEPDLAAPAGGEATPVSRRSVRFGRDRAPDDVAIYERAQLPAGTRLDGPVIISEAETTVVIRPGWTVEVDPDGSLLAQREEAA